MLASWKSWKSACAQLALLGALGADVMRGFLCSRPLPLEKCGPFLAGCCSSADGRLLERTTCGSQ